MANNDPNMLGNFFSTLFKFIGKMILWALWAIFRATELICQGLAAWIKNNLTQ
jgi:hypothetical protein